MVEIKCFGYSDKVFFDSAIKIRFQVFVVELNIPQVLECDSFDKTSCHYLVFNNSIPVATARWRETAKGIKLERFAVLKESRGTGFGSSLLKRILSDLKPKGKRIYLHSQISSVFLYEKNGFFITGEQFEEAGIAHLLMCYQNNL